MLPGFQNKLTSGMLRHSYTILNAPYNEIEAKADYYTEQGRSEAANQV